MTLPKALAYFVGEALVSLWRSWKVSLLAIMTIAVSLFVGGLFLVASNNLSAWVEDWQRQAKVVVYLQPDLTAEAREQFTAELKEIPGVVAIEDISSQQAAARFRTSFPSLGGLLDNWEEEPLPPSMELSVDRQAVGGEKVGSRLRALEQRQAVIQVDDDHDWLAELERVVLVLRGVGLMLGIVLISAAAFTVASVVRLTAFLYREEIAVMRLVGATELYVAGPFYVQGFLQGLAGGTVACIALFAAFRLLLARLSTSIMADLLLGRFLAPSQMLFLVAAGAGAGLFGAVLSLRRETTESD